MEALDLEKFEGVFKQNPGKFSRCKFFLKNIKNSNNFSTKLLNLAKLVIALYQKGYTLEKETVKQLLNL